MGDKKVPVRLSHVLGFCGPGSIVRATDEYIVPADTSFWNKGRPAGRILTNVCQVRSALGIDKKLYAPPTATIEKEGKRETVKGVTIWSVRFPAWTHCTKCGRLHYAPWHKQKTDRPICQNDKCKGARLVQVPWVLVHSKGYMDDLPWHWLAHKDYKGKCEDHEKLHIQFKQKIIISCKAEGCGAKIELTPQALSRFEFNTVSMRKQPWLSYKENQVPRDELKECPATALEIGDSRIYKYSTENALVIPPESRRTGSLAAKLANMPEVIDYLLKGPRSTQKRRLKTQARKLDCSEAALKAALEELEKDCDEFEKITPDILKPKEYEAFLTEISDFKEGEQFITKHWSRKWKQLGQKETTPASHKRIVNIIDNLIAVSRLREISVFKEFMRGASKNDDTGVPPDLKGNQDWLPALELWGEGIFFTLKEEHISKWEKNPLVIKRMETIAANLEKPCELLSNHLISLPQQSELPRFILLHTIAHLFIRQLEYLAGYPAASLKERLYWNLPDSPGGSMAGILVYVAVPDKAGSLGGLYEQAEPKKFLTIMDEVFKHAEWCSLDPVCSEHIGQGPCNLNLAACHACVHIPDTACSYSNILLDRMLISGTPGSENEEGFYGFLSQ